MHVTPRIGASLMPQGSGHQYTSTSHYYSIFTSSLLPTPTPTTNPTTVQNDDYRINAVDPDAATQEMDHDPFETGQSPGNRRCKRS